MGDSVSPLETGSCSNVTYIDVYFTMDDFLLLNKVRECQRTPADTTRIFAPTSEPYRPPAVSHLVLTHQVATTNVATMSWLVLGVTVVQFISGAIW